jgi:dihydroflavonol-4-reductase
MKTVVTGATGHVGANLVRALLDQGRSVRVLLHVNRRGIEGLDVEVAEGDVCDANSLFKAFEGADVVYNLSAHISLSMNSWSRCESINVIGTRNVVDACLRTGVKRLVHFSSIHALEQHPLDIPVDETRPLVTSRRHPPYDRSKAAGELEISRGIEKGLEAIVINPTGIIGPYDYQPSHFGEVLLSLAQGKLPALINGGFDWVDVRDVVRWSIVAEEKAMAGARYLLSGHWASISEIAAMVKDAVSVKPPAFVCPLWLADISAPFADGFARLAGKRPLYTPVALIALHGNRNISHVKADRDLGYSPRPLKETIVDTIKWFQSCGRLACDAVKNEARVS